MINQPIFFERNRVGRVYLGGKLFHDFFGDPAVDNLEPEEWIASGVCAINKVMKHEREGVSRLEGTDIYFDELIRTHKDELLGPRGKLRILVKVLDSAIRLPAQAHPDRAFSRAHFDSEYGKTESWLILGTRPGAKLFFGFKDGVTREDFVRAIDESEQDKDAMEKLMCEITPKVGEMYLVRAKTVHAIGKGCLILEIQEPTDFTIQPERYCGDYRLSDEEMYLSLDRESAIECFNFGPSLDPKCEPLTTFVDNSVKIEELIGKKDTECFIVNRITLAGGEYRMNIENSYGIYIVSAGEGTITGDAYSREVKRGDYFFMPYHLMGRFTLLGNLEVIECY